MPKTAVLDVCPAECRITLYHEEDGKTFIETRQDAEPIIEAAKILAEVPPDPETGFRFICMIDAATLNRSFVEGWFHDKNAWRKWASDPAHRAYTGGRTNLL